MAMFRYFVFVVFLWIVPVTFYAQKDESMEYVVSARKSWGNLNYEAAEQHYKSALDINSSSFDALFELGIYYKEIKQNTAEAIKYFERSFEKIPSDTVYEVFYYLGLTYQEQERYPQAIASYERFKNGIIKNDLLKLEIDNRIAQCSFATQYDTVLWDGKFVNFGSAINSEQAEYCAVLPLKDSLLLFTRRNEENMEVQQTSVAFEDIFMSKQKKATYHSADRSAELPGYELLKAEGKSHNSVVSSSVTGDTLIIYRNNLLWMTSYTDNQWSTPVKMPKQINMAKYQRHGCFSPDARSFYFSTHYKKGEGGYDLMVSHLLESGEWSEPASLGKHINTSGNEDSPFITADGKGLYFSSTGHLGYGGYDVYFAEWKDTAWGAPVNMGKPFNSSGDDIYFSIANDKRQTALLSSNRKGGLGKMDIYYYYAYGQAGFSNCGESLLSSYQKQDSVATDFVDSLLLSTLRISGKDTVYTGKENVFSSTDCAVNGARITHVYWKLDDEIVRKDSIVMKYDSVGTYTLYMEVLARDDQNEEHRFCITKDVVVEVEKVTPVFVPKVFLDTNEIVLKVGSKLKANQLKPLPDGFAMELESIYFNFGKSDIRPDQRKIMDYNIQLIKSNPDLVIKIVGHTDAVGTKEANLKLSQKRAQSAVNYLVKKGVPLNQITAVLSSGVDEKAIHHKKADGSDDIEKMEFSRRVDFHIIGVIK
jgi:outer membrane protein OmpA-like peptidoglycan-associated protein/tetratricopeptide (TPR) repeat protein